MHRVSCFVLTLIVGSVVFAQSEINPKTNQTDQPTEKIYTAKQVSKKFSILKKPVPDYTELARANGVEGSVLIRAVFRSTGKVTNIVVVKRLPNGLTEAAIDAVKRIVFKPAEKDGAPVSMYVQLEYNFRL